jgi:predicted nucleic-acid-binding Zn-ribbon protein
MKKTPLKRRKGPGLKKSADVPKKSGFKKKPLKNKSIELKKEASKKKHLVQKKKRNLRRKQIRKTSSNPLSREIKLCDLAFSQMIRLSNADQNGIVKCYTCSYRGFWKKDSVECGHFRGRTHMNTRWLRLNVACQCTRCNQLKSGNLEVYEKNLIRDHGPGIISYLDRESKKVTKLTVERVKNLKEYFESEVIKLKNKLAV